MGFSQMPNRPPGIVMMLPLMYQGIQCEDIQTWKQHKQDKETSLDRYHGYWKTKSHCVAEDSRNDP